MYSRINKPWRFILIAVLTSAFVTVASISRAVYLNVVQPSPKPIEEVATLVSNSPNQISSSVELGKSCFPANVSGFVFIGEFQGTHEIFQLWRLTSDREVFLRVNTLFGEACGLAFDGRSDRIFSDQVSMDIAQRLSLLFYQNQVNELGGIEKLEAIILEDIENAEHSHEGGPVFYPPESIWALRQLGIILPEGEYEVLEPKLRSSQSI